MGLSLHLFGLGVHPVDLSGHKPDYAGRPKFTEKLGITAGEALFTEGDVVFKAHITGLSIRVIDTGRHDYLTFIASGRFGWRLTIFG